MQAARGASLNDHAQPRHQAAVLLVVAAVVLALDYVTKAVAVAELTGRAPVDVVDGILRLRLVRNPGAAFGFAQGMTVVLTCIAAAVVAMILRVSRRLQSRRWAVALGLVLGGAFGNLGDRLFRRPGPLRGHVIDFLELPHWPVFNLADSAIMTGAAVMVLLSLRGVSYDKAPVRGGSPGG